jgi:hypothetical protein
VFARESRSPEVIASSRIADWFQDGGYGPCRVGWGLRLCLKNEWHTERKGTVASADSHKECIGKWLGIRRRDAFVHQFRPALAFFGGDDEENRKNDGCGGMII